MIQLSQGRLSDIERGKNKPSADTLVAVAEFFNVSAAWLLQGTGKPPTHVDFVPAGKPRNETDTGLSESEQSLLREYRRLDDAEKKQLWMFLDFLSYTKNHNKGISPSGFTEQES